MKPQTSYPFYFIAAPLALYLVFFIVPSFSGVVYSFTDWSSYSDEVNFVGFENFAIILSPDENYLLFIWNTLVFTFWTIIIKTLFGLALAVLLNQGVRWFVNYYRVLIYMPVILPTLVVALVFRSILNPASGLLNDTLRFVGLDVLALPWLTDPKIALYSVIAVDSWKGIGYIMVILLAGLQAISKDYYEAAKIDGAGEWDQFRYITIPMLMPSLMIVTVLNALYGLRVFDIVYALTNGGPGYATEVLSTEIFKAFSKGQFGLGTAISSVLFVILAAAGYLIIRAMERRPAASGDR